MPSKQSEQLTRNAADAIATLVANIADFSSSQPSTTERLASTIPQRWGRNLENMHSLLAQLEQLSQPGLDAVSKRYQTMTSLTKASSDIWQAMSEFNDSQKTFKAATRALYQRLSNAQGVCRTSPNDGRQAVRLRQQCEQLPQAEESLNQTVKRGNDIFVDLTSQWQAINRGTSSPVFANCNKQPLRAGPERFPLQLRQRSTSPGGRLGLHLPQAWRAMHPAVGWATLSQSVLLPTRCCATMHKLASKKCQQDHAVKEEEMADINVAELHHVKADVSLDLNLQPGQDAQFSITNREDGSAQVGIIDVAHRAPNVQGKGTSLITWGEALRWWPNPTSPGESWQKVVTIKNQSRSVQEVTFRFVTLGR